MRRTAVAALFLGGVFAVASFSDAQPPGGGQPPGGQPPGTGFGKGFGEKGGKGFGGFGMGMMATPGQLISTGIQEMLKLSDDQKKQLDALQKEVDAKLDKLLTEDQKKQLKEMKDRGPGRGFGGPPGGPGGPGGFGGPKGGPGGGPPGGGEPPAKKP
jgi:hypothetical protein